MQSVLFRLTLWLGLTGGCLTIAAPDAPSIRETDYKGWQHSFVLANGKVELVVVPEISRIMSFSLRGGKNALWENSKMWGHAEAIDNGNVINYGGSKLWLAPQAKWPGGIWPPDICLDRSPCTVEYRANSVSMTGKKSALSGLQMTKTVTVMPDKPGVKVNNTIRNVSDRPAAWSIWEVTQLPPGGHVFVPAEKDSKITSYTEESPFNNQAVMRVSDGMMIMETAQVKGIRGVKNAIMQREGWLAYSCDNLIFIKKFLPLKPADLPPTCANSEIYIRGDYVELETIGPYRTLNPGESCSYAEEWYLLEAPPTAKDVEIIARINLWLDRK